MAGRINRMRQGYFDAAPQVARYLPPPGPDTPPAIAAQAGGVQPVVVSVPDDPRDAGPGRHQRIGGVGGGGSDHRAPWRWPRTSRGIERPGGLSRAQRHDARPLSQPETAGRLRPGRCLTSASDERATARHNTHVRARSAGSRSLWSHGVSPLPRQVGHRGCLRPAGGDTTGVRAQSGSERGSPKRGSTLPSKRVIARIWLPVRVSTSSELAWAARAPGSRR